MARARNTWLLVATWLIAGCTAGQGPASPADEPGSEPVASTESPSPSPTSAASREDQLAAADAFVDAFYSFDADSLQAALASAEVSAPAIDGAEIISVQTGSNDPEIVRQAFDWVFTTYPELLGGACKGFDEGAPESGGDCARAVVADFEEFAASEDFPGL